MVRLRSSLASALVLLAGCGGSAGEASPAPTRETWVVRAMTLPVTAQERQAAGFDLDGNGTVDNALGNILAALTSASAGGVDLQSGADAAIDSGAAVELVETYSGASATVSFRTGTPSVAPCTDPQDITTCAQHLTGSTPFTADAALDPPLGGAGTADAFSVGPGAAHVVVPLFGNTPLTLPLVKARASFTRSAGQLAGKVGGGVPQAAIDGVVLPAMQAWAEGAVQRDCPGGACVSGSLGVTLLALFDADLDGAVSLAELQGSDLIATLFNPDLDTDGNGTPDALSMGVALELVGARF